MKTSHINNDPIFYQDASTLAELIRKKQLSPVEVMQAHLNRIEAVNPTINAIVTIAPYVLEAAKNAEAAVMKGNELGPLHGVPFTVKDSIDTAQVLTQRGSPIFRGRIPDKDATSVARMKSAGGILIGKTNLPEFSYWIESDNLLSGRSNNPWDITLTPGGSSGGESAAIAAGMSPIGLGTDLAISVRGPAAQTGIVSLKATHGSVPMTGIWPRAPRRFWHVGPMARSIRDLSLAFSQLAGPDGQDGFSVNARKFDSAINAAAFRRLRIGWMVGPGFGPVDPEVATTVRAAAEALRSLGLQVEQVGIPALEKDFALDVFNRIHIMEMKPAFRDATAGTSDDQIYKMAKTMLSLPDTSMADYIDAEQAAERIRDGYVEYFRDFDVLITHVLPIPAHKHGVTDFVIDGRKVDATYLQGATVPLNITGLPGISMRFGTSNSGLPINIQVIGSWFEEAMILQVASMLENVSPVRGLHPHL
jgi:aspartyl-tRNA(Asn)/glutamyl-tRNA(Gln) amidotransferase subunit A